MKNKARAAQKKMGLLGESKDFPGVEQMLRSRASDFMRNAAARSGLGVPNLVNDTQYDLVRFTYNYWELITLFETHWLARRIVEAPAQDMIRTWPKVVSELAPEDIGAIDRVIRRTGLKRDILTARTWANLFGGAGCLMVIEGDENRLHEPLKLDNIEIGSFKGLIPFDRWSGIQPNGNVGNDIEDPSYVNVPEKYTVTMTGGGTFEVHASRILRFLGLENPTPEREAYSWWGVSELEPVIEDIKKYDNLNWNVINLSFRANLLGLKYPDLAQMLSGLGAPNNARTRWAEKMSELNHLMSNQSLIPLPVDGGLESAQYSFSGLSEVMLTQMLVICAAARMAFTRLWGRSFTGLGSSANEGDEKVYEERIATENEIKQRPQLEKLYPVLFMSTLGEVPDDFDLVFPSIRVLDEKEKSDLAKAVVDTLTVALNSNIISPRKYAQELKKSSEQTDIFTNLDDEFIEKLSDDVEAGLGEDLFAASPASAEGNEEVELDPAESPQKVLKEDKKDEKALAAELRAKDSRHYSGPEINHAILSPSGHVSKRAEKSAKAEAFKLLFPEGHIPGPVIKQPEKKASLLRQAEELEQLAKRGMKPVAYKRKAEELRKQAAALDSVSEDSVAVNPDEMKPGNQVRVGGRLLTVSKVTEGKNLFDEPELHVFFKTGEAITVPVKQRAKDEIPPLSKILEVLGLTETEWYALSTAQREKFAARALKDIKRASRAKDEDGPGLHRSIAGLDIVIETAKGETRSGPGWSQVLPYDYGYIQGVEGADGDSMDVALGPESNGWAYIIDQRQLDGDGFDEHKCFLNWPSAKAALNAFKAGHHRANEVFMDWTPMSMADFIEWLKSGDHKRPMSAQ